MSPLGLRFHLLVLVMMPLFASTVGCTRTIDTPPQPIEPVLRSVLVDTEWLIAHHDHPALLIVDTRPAEQYAKGHIPASIHFDIASIQKVTPDKAYHLADPTSVCGLLGAAGIDPTIPVVVYDDGEDYRRAAYFFMALEAHGHNRVAVLDGGYRGWLAAAQPISTAAQKRKAVNFPPSRNSERLADKKRILEAIQQKDMLIVDSRSADEFKGLKSEAPRSGHIPTATNFAASENLAVSADGDSLCRFKSPDDLLEHYFAMPPERKIILYCNSGRRASVNYLALRMLGRDVAVYDGSWQEWASDHNLPIETAATNPVK